MYEDKDVAELVAAARKLYTVSMLAADVLSEEFDDLVRPSAEHLHAVLVKFPVGESEWDGSLADEHIEETVMQRFNASGSAQDVGIELRHTITGIKRQSTSKDSKDGNRAVARRALERAVAERFASMQKS